MSCWNRTLLALLIVGVAQAHVVSISNGELHINGRSATFELRVPIYEIEQLGDPETALFKEIRFGDSTRTSSACQRDTDWLTCHATYEFAQPVPDTLEVECSIYRATVPNHIHLLYAVRGENSDQKIFDQTTALATLRFHPPSLWNSLTRDGSAGALRLLQSPAGLLFLAVVALSARTLREALLLSAAFLVAEWAVRPISPFIPLVFSPEFLEAAMALTVVYLSGELLLLPAGPARWGIVPLLGLIHGLPFAAFPPLYLTGAVAVQALLLAALSFAALRMPASVRKPAAAAIFILAGAWFAKFLFT